MTRTTYVRLQPVGIKPRAKKFSTDFPILRDDFGLPTMVYATGAPADLHAFNLQREGGSLAGRAVCGSLCWGC